MGGEESDPPRRNWLAAVAAVVAARAPGHRRHMLDGRPAQRHGELLLGARARPHAGLNLLNLLFKDLIQFVDPPLLKPGPLYAIHLKTQANLST
jgi:hypothetical protein